MPISRYSDVIDAILHTITDKSMTSRDIQITIGRTREHTSRLMKKLSDDGLVQRHAGTKPFVYSLTDEGKKETRNTTNAIKIDPKLTMLYAA